jgi:fibronectin type 3 domain-containing protein
MQLSWPVIAGATSYRVYRRGPASDWVQQVTLSAPRWTDYDVQNGESFRYAVQAVNASGVSPWGMTSVYLVDPALPPAPANLVVQPGSDSLQLEWSPVSGATSYTVYSSPTQSGPYAYVGYTSGEFESRLRINGTNGTQVWVMVSATSSAGNGVFSREVSATASALLPSYTYLSAAALTPAGSVRLTWNAVSGATNYRIYRRLPTSTVALVSQTATLTFDDTGLTSGTSYTYYVEAENSVGPGAWSSPATVAAP